MATSTATPSEDPFVNGSPQNSYPRRSHFDAHLMASQNSASPSQTKRILESHLEETERRLREASKLGTTLVQQRKDLAARLKEVENDHGEGQIEPELRQKLYDIEAEYNEVRLGSKPRRSIDEGTNGAFALEGRRPPSPSKQSYDARRTRSPEKYSSQATDSPSKISVPSQSQRDQSASRTHDIEFATQISQSLLSQVKHLQAIVAEKDESLRTVTVEKSKMEDDAAGFSARLRNLDESEQRYKDENWSLETQTHELLAATKEAADREQRLNQSLSIANLEKTNAQKELDELKQANGKMNEDYATSQKRHEAELSGMRRNLTMGESEKGALQRRIDDLDSQNQELAKALAGRTRFEESNDTRDLAFENENPVVEHITPEHSPPPSPSKGTPRHSMLESETLKSSLNHAHRMIQNLKGNIHREKTEKVELKRMLQEARDELELRRGDGSVAPLNAAKRRKPLPQQDVFKKPVRPNMLGNRRNSKGEVIIDENAWEDHFGENSPSNGATARSIGSNALSRDEQAISTQNDLYGAFEASDAFETAHEREGTATETEAFQTGAESLGPNSSEEDLTETESGLARSVTIRSKRPSNLFMDKSANRISYMSTASTSAEEDDVEDVKTPAQPQQQRFRLKLNRGRDTRRSGIGSEASLVSSNPATARESPASFISSNNSTPAAGGQSLFAELGDLNGDEEGGDIEDTPSKASIFSHSSTPGVGPIVSRSPARVDHLPSSDFNFSMVDAGMMTEPWEPESETPSMERRQNDNTIATSAVAGEASVLAGRQLDNSTMAYRQPNVTQPKQLSNIGVQRNNDMKSKFESPVALHSRRSLPGAWEQPSEDLASIEPTLEDFPAVPFWAISNIQSQHIEPVAPAKIHPSPATQLPSIPSRRSLPGAWDQSLDDGPSDLAVESRSATPLVFSSIQAQHIEPVAPAEDNRGSLMPVVYSNHSEPLATTEEQRSLPSQNSQSIAPPIPPRRPPMSVSFKSSQQTASENVEQSFKQQVTSRSIKLPLFQMTISNIKSQETEPVFPQQARAATHVRPFETSDQMPRTEAPMQRALPEVEKEKIPTALAPGFFGSVFGWKATNRPQIAEDQTSHAFTQQDLQQVEQGNMPFKEISSNISQRQLEKSRDPGEMNVKPPVEMADHSSQTAISADQIENILSLKDKADAILMSDSDRTISPESPISPTKSLPGQTSPRKLRNARSGESLGSVRRARMKMSDPGYSRDDPQFLKANKRAGSATGSTGSVPGPTGSLPPLPPDHKKAIAEAASKVPSSQNAPGVMGPPLAPASAYKANPQFRPRTPVQDTQSPGRESSRGRDPFKGGITPRQRHSTARSASHLSRRGSVSSFASELDERFNIRTEGMPMPSGLENMGTDPRMIQAITQTMIGEYLWKYTRKAGRGEMSDNRHRRFFWVHPYTRTLYWSDRDPATAGRAELKAKSVAIEAVRVITDDNPMPPGLHRKSLVVITPGRSVKFTATTGQRHETWFNALSYLLLRTGPEGVEATGANGVSDYDQGITSEDVHEFNPSYGTQTPRPAGPSSLSSYNSRTTRNPSPIRQQPSLTTRQPSVPQLATSSTNPQAPQRSSSQQAQHSHQGSISRLSNIFRPRSAMRDSFSSRRSRHNGNEGREASIYDASVVHDSAEDLRQVIETQERHADQLENVRACCDGKHDVGSLAKGGRYRDHHHDHSHSQQQQEQQYHQEPVAAPQSHSRKTFSTNRFT
ncbi:MAG: hypothetical protein M1827_004503 [Pycnora praestabilis]|nr:MAG: hypothetical protein M1827_004503 [Pycnora praestabilis]